MNPGEALPIYLQRLGRRATPTEVLAWADDLLNALVYLHSQTPPLTHGKIVPEQLRVRDDGRLVLAHLGAASGQRSVLDDVYAVGETLYQLLAGEPPPPAASRQQGRRQGRHEGGDPLRPLTALSPPTPPDLARAIHHALDLDPARRFQSAAAMRTALRSTGGWQQAAARQDARARPDAAPATGEMLEPPTIVRPAAPAAAPAPIAASAPVPAGPPAPVPATPPISSASLMVDGIRRAAPTAGRRQGDGFHLALARGDHLADRWPLPPAQPASIGRTTAEPPDVDLRADRRVSRQHARVWRQDHRWWIEDAGSRYGTLVDGQPLAPGTPAILRPWSTVQCGDTTLFLAPPGWRRLRAHGLTLDIELAGTISLALAHAGLPVVGRMIARNQGQTTLPASTVQLALEPCFGPITLAVPALRPGASLPLSLPPIGLRYDVLEGQIERSRRRLTVAVDGDHQAVEPVECWLLPHNEWSTLPEHQSALATFVLPNHPLVAALATEVSALTDPNGPADSLLAALFEILSERWQVSYRLEPPHWATDSQKVRLPHSVLLDDAARMGEGTCLDLALLAAACLENLGLQPLVAVLDLGEWWHALVGCWDPPEPGVEAIRFDRPALLDRALWLDPTCATRDRDIRKPYREARDEAARLLEAQPLLFALDVTAARAEEIMPLPFAGQPVWSAGVSRAIAAARQHAEAVGGQVCTAALLAGLLTAGDGLARRVVREAIGEPDAAARTVIAALPAAGPGSPPGAASPGWQQVLDVARSRARTAGSPVVLEAHLLGALLALRSASLDLALARLSADQGQLARALREQDDGPDPTMSTMHGSR
ncbi:MAG: FHA domain-containing protein [Chloroflexi bacterium]|nr:FHA domain-containing protein [Chloroflexota bacterium]